MHKNNYQVKLFSKRQVKTARQYRAFQVIMKQAQFKTLISKGFLKHLTIKINGKSLQRFNRSSVIIKQDVRSKICIDIYSYKEVRMCENY